MKEHELTYEESKKKHEEAVEAVGAKAAALEKLLFDHNGEELSKRFKKIPSAFPSMIQSQSARDMIPFPTREKYDPVAPPGVCQELQDLREAPLDEKGADVMPPIVRIMLQVESGEEDALIFKRYFEDPNFDKHLPQLRGQSSCNTSDLPIRLQKELVRYEDALRMIISERTHHTVSVVPVLCFVRRFFLFYFLLEPFSSVDVYSFRL